VSRRPDPPAPRPIRDWPEPRWPAPIRARARRCRAHLLELRRCLIALCGDAEAIALDPSLCERIDTTPFDHTAADVIGAADNLLEALDQIL
jgi:hypothetical protein